MAALMTETEFENMSDAEQARQADALERAIKDGWQLEGHCEFWGIYVLRQDRGDYLRLDARRLAHLYLGS